MKVRVQTLRARNFKAFRDFQLNLNGRHVLVYGPNGSGKSSLYWALYTLLQSASKKPRGIISKYFDAADSQNLLNIYEDPSAIAGEVALTLHDQVSKIETTFRISRADHATFQQPTILKGNLASDFITYRFFFGFSHFRNSETFDLWPLFEKEILPFCVSTGGGNPLETWEAIKSGIANPRGLRGPGGASAYRRFQSRVDAFAAMLPGIIDSISTEAQRFYDEHFSDGDPARITLKLGLTTPPSFRGTNQHDSVFSPPVVEFGIQVGGTTINKPQVFLNEAKLTQLALSVRFAASLVNLHESDFKLLVLDDLLVSLDMSNRMKVVEILLSETFENYQKVVMTHELGFFREFRRKVGTSHPDWAFVRLEGNASARIEAKDEKTEIQKAEEYLHGHNLDEAALCLRKACEETSKRFVGPQVVNPTKEFIGLADSLRAARNKVLSELPVQLYERVLKTTPDQHRELLIGVSDADIDADPTLDVAMKGILKAQRRRLRQLMATHQVDRLRQVKLIDEILACTERVLNPSAHAGTPPLYEREVADALNLVRQLEATLT